MNSIEIDLRYYGLGCAGRNPGDALLLLILSILFIHVGSRRDQWANVSLRVHFDRGFYPKKRDGSPARNVWGLSAGRVIPPSL